MNKVITYLTTVDNPWNPFTNWDEWMRYDLEKGYNTCSRIDRLAPTSKVFPEETNRKIIDDAMNKLIEFGAISKEGKRVEYKKVSNT